MDEFIYQETETFNDVVLDNLARFRIPDPNNENNRFFTDETGAASTLVLTAPNGTTTNISSHIAHETPSTSGLSDYNQSIPDCPLLSSKLLRSHPSQISCFLPKISVFLLLVLETIVLGLRV